MWKKNRHTMPDNGRCLMGGILCRTMDVADGRQRMADKGRCLMAACYAGQWTLLMGGILCRTMDAA